MTSEQDRPERSGDTLRTPLRPLHTARGDACLVHIYPTGPNMGRRYPLGELEAVIGRGTDCDVHIDDHSVSRRHARVLPVADGHVAIDLESTNGTFVNGEPVTRHPLKDGDYLRVGNCIYRYLAGGNVEAEYHEEIYRLAIIDGLTDVPNKRYLMEFLGRELARSARHGRPLALVLFDIDHFKKVNDDFGHLCGDHILREMALCLKGTIRAEELLARYGGEEFAVVLPEATVETALVAAERIRGLVESQPFNFDGQRIAVTISLGVACTSGSEEVSSLDLIDRADQKLYEAKRTGRNRVAI
jgi:diguanylate cyclase (GGDEF)-like protein